MANNSFEIEGTTTGAAESWVTSPTSGAEGLAVFDSRTEGGVALWSPAEDFEELWYMPFLVHADQDVDSGGTPNGVTAPDATANWTEIYTLLTDCLDKFRAHLRRTGNVHFNTDEENIPPYGVPTSEAEAITLANALKDAMYYTLANGMPAGHLSAWPDVHGKEDTENRVTAPDATEINSCATLANDIKAKFNLHIVLVSYGNSNSECRFSFDITTWSPFVSPDLEIMSIADYADEGELEYEGFEAGWALPDMVPDKIAEQTDQISTDNGEIWPIGHVELLDHLPYTAVEFMPSGAESFNKDWLLPGDDAEFPCQKYSQEYWDEENEEWRFVDGKHLELFNIGEPPDWEQLDPTKAMWQFSTGYYPAETFEFDWKDNEVGYQKYYDETEEEWRFLTAQLDVGITETFESDWILELDY